MTIKIRPGLASLVPEIKNGAQGMFCIRRTPFFMLFFYAYSLMIRCQVSIMVLEPIKMGIR